MQENFSHYCANKSSEEKAFISIYRIRKYNSVQYKMAKVVFCITQLSA
jgi:hypothetical protein